MKVMRFEGRVRGAKECPLFNYDRSGMIGTKSIYLEMNESVLIKGSN